MAKNAASAKLKAPKSQDEGKAPDWETFKSVEMKRLEAQIKITEGIAFWAETYRDAKEFIGEISVAQTNYLVERVNSILHGMKDKLEAMDEETAIMDPYEDPYKMYLVKPEDIETGELFDYYAALLVFYSVRPFGEKLEQYNYTRRMDADK